MDPKHLHDLDQETGPLHELAVKLAAYYRSLVGEGFSPRQALRIVIDYQRTIIRTLRRKD